MPLGSKNIRLEPAPVRGFRFAGVSAGLRKEPDRLDLGVIAADGPVAAAGVFTTNRVKAAPVLIAQERIKAGRLQAIVVNSGSANCFTGKPGLKLAHDSAMAVADELGCDHQLVVPCSTGVIGRLYDLDHYREGAHAAVAALAPDGLEQFARAIMTTDTHPKIASSVIRVGGTNVTIAGCAKGAGMIEPKMATMLGYLVTDAAIRPPALRRALAHILPSSFNAITIDGDMSTNDTLILMASGAAGNRPFEERDTLKFERALADVAETLARELVRDGEGATKLVTIEVRGARTTNEAEKIARQIGNSPLVKTAFFGCDPNFGRIAMAIGKAGVPIDLDRIEVAMAGIKIASRGALHNEALEAAAIKMKDPEFSLVVDLKAGRAKAAIMTCDFSYDYVKINAEYTT